MTLYEPLVCFASQPRLLAESPGSLRECLHIFIDLNGKLNLRVKRVLKANDIGLVITEWSFNGTGSEC
jgi:hypothetical protein